MRKELKLPSILVSLFLTAYLIYFTSIGNYEFLVYILVTAAVFFALIKLDDTYKFPIYSIWLFVIWIVLHMFGGSIIINGVGDRLYAWVIFNWIGAPYHILKYDQIVHAYAYIVFTILVYHSLSKHFKKQDTLALSIFAVLASLGISLGNEIVEFAMVVFADAGNAVGDYYNTGLDMVFNLIGALIGIGIVRKNS